MQFFLGVKSGRWDVGAPEFQEHCAEAEKQSVAVLVELFGASGCLEFPHFFVKPVSAVVSALLGR